MPIAGLSRATDSCRRDATLWRSVCSLRRGAFPAQSLPGDPDWWATGGPGYKSVRTRGDTHTAAGLYVDLAQTFDFIGRWIRPVHRNRSNRRRSSRTSRRPDWKPVSAALERPERQADQAAIWRGRRHRDEAGGKDRHDRAWTAGLVSELIVPSWFSAAAWVPLMKMPGSAATTGTPCSW